jgi:hypothetical protein
MRGRVFRVALLVALGLGTTIGPAVAQVGVPPIPLPPLPPQLAPVFEIIAPVASPVCGDATLVGALGPGLVAGELGMPLPVDIVPALGPVFVVCGSIPQPPQRLTCSLDTGARFLVDTLTLQAAGTALPVDIALVGPLVGEVIVVQDKLPPPLNTAGLDKLAIGTLVCTAADATTTPAPSSGAAAPTPAPVDTDQSGASVLPADLTAPALDTSAAPAVAPADGLTSQQPALRTVAGIRGPGYAYPVVFGLPLVLLVLGGYLGWALTQPVESAQR